MASASPRPPIHARNEAPDAWDALPTYLHVCGEFARGLSQNRSGVRIHRAVSRIRDDARDTLSTRNHIGSVRVKLRVNKLILVRIGVGLIGLLAISLVQFPS
jgi:hypothetical protein